jgi:predicted phosphoribosyltransferase/dienelactone hydrolase
VDGDRLYFADRADAGRRLAALLGHLRDQDPVVLGLPRGGVPVAAEVASALGAPLDVILVRKLGVPWQPELAMGAIGEGGVEVLNPEIVSSLRVSPSAIDEVREKELVELGRRARAYRGSRPMLDLEGRLAVIVDDGIATGATAEAACGVARAHGARRIVVAAPVASAQARRHLLGCADEVVCIGAPRHFGAIGVFYRDFSPTPDHLVTELLAVRPDRRDGGRALVLDVGGVALPGLLVLPAGTGSLVLFAHGSGSSMHSPRNRGVAQHLNRAGHGTLLFDLLTDTESQDRRRAFDIPLLTRRLEGATRRVAEDAAVAPLAVGFFGASTGAAAALDAAAELGSGVRAVVARGGRPDLARRLPEVSAPVLLVVGGDDRQVLALNREAAGRLTAAHEVRVIPGATHLFEEPGALDQVARLAADWFTRHLV